MKGVDRLVGDARERHPRPMDVRERTVVWALSIAYAGAASAVALVVPWNRHPTVWVLVALVLLCAAVSAITFEVGSVTAVATPLGLLPLLFVAPLPLVPALVPLGYLLATVPEFLTRTKHVDRSIYAICDSWLVLGPVLVIGLLASGPPKLEWWAVYVLAFVAQVVSDAAPTVLRERLARAIRVRESRPTASWTSRIDA